MQTSKTVAKLKCPISKFINEFGYPDSLFECDSETAEPYSTDCFGVTLLALLYNPVGFDFPMLNDALNDSDFTRTVKGIIRDKFVIPLRQGFYVDADFASQLSDSTMHLCSGTLDIEELLTILFEFTYKMAPFINYSMEMCD